MAQSIIGDKCLAYAKRIANFASKRAESHARMNRRSRAEGHEHRWNKSNQANNTLAKKTRQWVSYPERKQSQRS